MEQEPTEELQPGWEPSLASQILDSLTDCFWYEIGRETAASYLNRRDWLYRRVESIEFLGRHGLRRHVSIDFELPPLPDLPDRAPPEGRLVPLTVFVKWPPLHEFDYRGPHGQPISLYRRTTNKQLDFGLLIGMTEQLSVRISPPLRERLALMVATNTPPPSAVQELMSDLESPLADAARDGHATPVQLAEISGLAAQLANSSVLWAPVVATKGSDCIVKFSYLDSYAPTRNLRRWLISCSWRDRAFYIPLPHAGQYTRYHLDVRSPNAAIEFLQAQTKALPGGPITPAGPEPANTPARTPPPASAPASQPAPNAFPHTHAAAGPNPAQQADRPPNHPLPAAAEPAPPLPAAPPHATGPGTQTAGTSEPSAFGNQGTQAAQAAPTRRSSVALPGEADLEASSEIIDRHIHIYHPPRSAPSHRIYLVVVIAASREGFVSHCLAMATALALVMSVAYADLHAAAENLPAFVVLLAAVPLVLGYLLVRSEAPLEREGVHGIRTMAIAAGSIPILGGLALVFAGAQSTGKVMLSQARPAWAALTIASWLIVIGLGWSWAMAASSRQAQRRYRAQNIAASSAVVAALGLIVATALSVWPNSSRGGHPLTVQLGAEEVKLVALCAALTIGASALHGLIAGIRLLARHEEPTSWDRFASTLVLLSGAALIWGTIAAAVLTAWQTLTLPARTAPLIPIAETVANATLPAAAVLILTTVAWLHKRPGRLLGDPQVPLAGLLLAAVPVTLRAVSALSPCFQTISPGVAWAGIALWLACMAGAIRVPRPPEPARSENL